MEHRAGSSISQNFASVWAALEVLKSIIRSAPRPPVTVTPSSDEGQGDSSDLRNCLQEAYDGVRYPAYTPLAIRLLEPYFSIPEFADVWNTLYKALYPTRVLDEIPMLELLIEAHELTLQADEQEVPITPKAGMKMLDVVSKRPNYGPVTNCQTFFFLGSRFGSGSIKDYGKALHQLQGDSEVRNLSTMRRVYVELVLCLVRHLRSN